MVSSLFVGRQGLAEIWLESNAVAYLYKQMMVRKMAIAARTRAEAQLGTEDGGRSCTDLISLMMSFEEVVKEVMIEGYLVRFDVLLRVMQ